MGSAAFLLPAGRMVPLSGRPPVTEKDGGMGEASYAAACAVVKRARTFARERESRARARGTRRDRPARNPVATPRVASRAEPGPAARGRRPARRGGPGAGAGHRVYEPGAVAGAPPRPRAPPRLDRRAAPRPLSMALPAAGSPRRLVTRRAP